MLNHKKSQSILQWFNSLTTKGDVNSLQQFSDGSHFYEIVASLQSFFIQESKNDNESMESVIIAETDIGCTEQVITSVEDETMQEKTETSASESDEPFVIKESDHTDTQKKYEVIKKFIDDHYKVESSSLIDYKDCQKGKELELAKVAVFLLSAMVQSLLSTEDKVVYNTTLLEPEIQENIRECLSLVLVEKDSGENPIKRQELHRVLSRAASCKGTPIRRQPIRSTSDPYDFSEGIKSVPKKRREKASNYVYENLQDSPLRNLLESPKIQYKAAIFKKDAELAKLRNAILNEENKVYDLKLEKANLIEELEKQKKELEFYKKELVSQREALCEKEEQSKLKAEEIKVKNTEEERLKKLIEVQEEEIKQLKESNEALQAKVDDIEEKFKQEQEATVSLIKESCSLKDKIQILELDNENKDDTVKTLNEKVTNLENDLKMYQQMYQEASAFNNRKELTGSPDSPETLSTIIYKDERKTLERKIHLKGETSKNKDSYSESLEIMVDRLQDNVSNLEIEKNLLEAKLEFYESEFGDTSIDISPSKDLNLIKNENPSRSISITSEDKVYILDRDTEVNAQLWSNVLDDSRSPNLETRFRTSNELFTAKTSFEKSIMVAIIRQLAKSNLIDSAMVRALKGSCMKINNSSELSARLRDLLIALRLRSEPSVTTRRSRSIVANEIDAMSKTETEIEVLQQTVLSLRNKLAKKEEELKIAIENSETSTTDFKKEIDKLRQELINFQEKYLNMEKLAKKKDDDVKKALVMYQKLVKLDKKNSGKRECSEECEKVRRRAKELNKECIDYEKETTNLRFSLKDIQGTVSQLKLVIKGLEQKNEELRRKLWLETSALAKNTAERDSVIFHYFTESKHEPPKKLKDLELKKIEQRKSSRPILKVDAYILNPDDEQSASTSMLASRSIRNSFFQAADEDDFLNESSLAEIHNGGTREDASGERRLEEIRRRNTLCPPHLQSSYPLEIQDMTPSEKKYYDPKEISINLSKTTALYQEKGNSWKKFKSRYLESESEDSDNSQTFPVKKRKVAKTDSMFIPESKKPCQRSSNAAQAKPSTPLKRVAAFVRRQSTFKTPISVHRLMSMPRKSKAHRN